MFGTCPRHVAVAVDIPANQWLIVKTPLVNIKIGGTHTSQPLFLSFFWSSSWLPSGSGYGLQRIAQ